ncbi:MAG: DNA mismatch repair protein MutS [Ferruginibacter sp.]|nr:DNA mismatch repair protein MutS [Cytophagales bacterium]
MTSSEQYQQRQRRFEQSAREYETKYRFISWLRVFLFVAGGATTWFLYQRTGGWPALVAAGGFMAAFVVSLRRHNQVERRRNHWQFLAYLNGDEAGRTQNRFVRPETGETYAETGHFYADDLDVFGNHSLFRLLNRTHTFGGAQKLAGWLKGAAAADQITARQRSLTELAPKLEWRQQLEAEAMHYREVNQPTSALLQWMAAPAADGSLVGMRVLRLLPLLTIPLLLAWAVDALSFRVVFWFLLGHLLVLGRIFRSVKEITEKTVTVSKTLLAYANVLRVIEEEAFDAPELRALQSVLRSPARGASRAIGEFAVVLQNLNYRNNPYFYLLVGIPTLWDLQFLIRTEEWKKRHRSDLPRWVDALAEWEALNSLAGFAFSNPGFAFPVISAEPIELHARGLGHVLIGAEKRVANDVALRGPGKTLVITGSNMSGKSTFLRTVGVNTVLALAGAPVCAEFFTVSVMQVFTSMRTQDSLAESVSSFYAELKRLKQLIEFTAQPQPVLYLLDEILKGTNSQDRHHGAKALIRQLHRQQASGFVSTHDLELGRMADEHPEWVANYSFNSELIGDQLHFDYTLYPGLCRSFNASQLMKQIGIEM